MKIIGNQNNYLYEIKNSKELSLAIRMLWYPGHGESALEVASTFFYLKKIR